MDRDVTSKYLNNLIYGSRSVNQMDSPHQTVDDLIGIVYRGESLLSVPSIFPGINRFCARRRVAGAWLVEEIHL